MSPEKARRAGSAAAAAARARMALLLLTSLTMLLPMPLTRAWGQQQTSAPAAADVMPKRSGEVVVKVDDFDAARAKAIQALSGLGAHLVGSRNLVDSKGHRHGYLTVTLPAEKLPEALPAVRAVGNVYAEKIVTEDGTSSYEELARRIGRLQQHQQRLAGVLGSERRLRGSDILFIQDRLFRAGVDEESLTQQRVDIARGSRICTLTVTLFEPIQPAGAIERARLDAAAHFARAKEHALAAGDRLRGRAVSAAAYALVFAPVWIPLLVAGFFVVRLLRRFVGRALARLRSTASGPRIEQAPAAGTFP